MPVPSPRNPILPARGNYSDLSTNLASLTEGEICYALDQDKIYIKEGGVLVPVSGAVDSVNGQTGVAVLDADDIDDTATAHKFATAAQLANADNAIQVDGGLGATNGQVLSWDSGTGLWAPAAPGAAGGGSDKVFFENDQTVTTDYTLTSGKNAMSAGPVTVNSGITVTVPSGQTWTIV